MHNPFSIFPTFCACRDCNSLENSFSNVARRGFFRSQRNQWIYSSPGKKDTEREARIRPGQQQHRQQTTFIASSANYGWPLIATSGPLISTSPSGGGPRPREFYEGPLWRMNDALVSRSLYGARLIFRMAQARELLGEVCFAA